MFGLAMVCYGIVKSFPVQKEKLLGSWVGFTDVPNDFYRLVLSDTGGLVAYSFTGQQPILYKINSWELGPQGQLRTVITGISTNSYPIIITGEAKPWKLDLVVKSPGQDWQHNVAFYQEQLIEDRIKLLKNSMDTFRERQITGPN
jgi:hypothetical protein